MPPVTNAINVLQACIYKSVKTGLYLKSIVDPHVVKFIMLMPVFTINYQVLEQKSMVLWNQTTLFAATNYFRNRPVSTDL